MTQTYKTRSIEAVLAELVEAADRSDQYASLAGGAGDSLENLRIALGEASARCTELLTHSHVWNDSGYCDICGADGNA